jgi:UPF0755 protein
MSESGTKADKQKKPRKKRKAIFRIFMFLVIVALTFACSYISYNYVLDRNKDKDKDVVIKIDRTKSIDIEIPLGANTDVIARILTDKGVIRYPVLFKLTSKINGYDGMYQAGTHIVNKGLDYESLMRVLSDKPESIKVMIPEGQTNNEIRELLVKKKLVNRDKFDKIANETKFDFKFLSGVPQRENKLEGYLFPDTYEFGMNAGEQEIIRRMLANFVTKFKPEYEKQIEVLNQKYPTLKMTRDKVVILASIIEKEAQKTDERETIAGVFYNRLISKDKTLNRLQSCATIQYIFLNGRKSATDEDKKRIQSGIINDVDTQVEDPYNTYARAGLPPGPICNPGEASILAALNPEQHDYFYFAVNPEGSGTHHFSKTYKEHVNFINASKKK